MSDASTLEAVGQETSRVVGEGSQAILSEVSFANVLRDLDLLPSLGWRHLVLNLVTENGQDRIDTGARWIYAERLTGRIGSSDPQELILVAYGHYTKRADTANGDLSVTPLIDGCAALEAGSIQFLKAVRFPNNDVAAPISMEDFELTSKLRHARSQLGNPVIYRKHGKQSRKEAAA